MARHTLTLDGETIYKCSDCKKSFSPAEDLKRHMLTHSKERPYTYVQCNKPFRLAETPTVEKRPTLAQNVKPHKCTQCYYAADVVSDSVHNVVAMC